MIPGITASRLVPSGGDPNFSQVALLLPFNGTNGGTSFPDASSAPHTVTPSGNAQTSTAQSKWGGSSAAFDGTADYLTVAAQNDWKFLHDGTTAFTVEMWLRSNVVGSTMALFGNGSSTSESCFALWVTGSREVVMLIGRAFAGQSVIGLQTTGLVPPAGEWYFLQATFDPSLASNNAKIWVNGTLAGQATKAFTPSTANPTNAMIIGGFGGAPTSASLNGYMQDLRVSKVIRPSTVPGAAFPTHA